MWVRENEIGLIFKIYIKELCGEVLLSEVSVILYVLSDFLFRLVLRFDYEIDILICLFVWNGYFVFL